MDFITAPLVTFIVFAGVYGLFELFVRRRERMAIIEKISDKLDPTMINGKLDFSFIGGKKFSFGTLKIACLLLGVGLGLLVGFFICRSFIEGYGAGNCREYDLVSMVNGACVLIFGGIGLLVAFFAEMKYLKSK